MARENKTKRDERRFGRPERLADLLLSSDWVAPPWWDISTAANRDRAEALSAQYKRWLSLSAVVDATNVCLYWQEKEIERHGQPWDITNDIPSFRPPFDSMFVECRATHPGHLKLGQFGVLFERAAIDAGYDVPVGTENLYTATLWVMRPTVNMPLAPVMLSAITTDAKDRILEFNGDLLTPDGSRVPDDLGGFDYGRTRRFLLAHYTAPMLAVVFMNCRGVTVEAHDPGHAVNRERQKAGFKPFVRYHTINIEPMRKVLRDKGGVATNGLKKALHICRGHFVTCETSFMGRPLERPLMFWKPAHVRGTLKQGVVVSDYDVSPPKSKKNP